MQNNPTLEELRRVAGEHLADLIQHAYEAGKKAGEAEARAKVLGLFGPAAADDSNRSKPGATAPSPPSPAGSGKVSGPLREVITAMDIGEDGVDTREVKGFADRMPGIPPLTEMQVRAGLKTLVTSGFMEKAKRGRFRPISRRDAAAQEQAEPEEEAEPPQPLHDELFGAPKANGEARSWAE